MPKRAGEMGANLGPVGTAASPGAEGKCAPLDGGGVNYWDWHDSGEMGQGDALTSWR